ncbi:ATP synthase F1 subunit gamma [Lacrimispora algidixylanolytica]|uniref:ATP synthase gamma chain n=1 Tax=Lacrimispora algidixylanolytica TaxID=94868 RepID=A0A419TCV3_9FIRM|nr:ATP synthase F1 subunit gamma [Lacrimispora algidixylanolytica]RKD35298.1 ATP synthase F1 subunit gamma [Lacrimispora algidixylanolytica]
MANAREIQSRMNSIKSTMKITNAMYTISSSKLKRARKALTDTEPYFYALQSTIARIIRHTPDINDSYLDTRPEIKKKDRKIGYLVVTADKGLAGAYNHNVFKLAQEQIDKGGNPMLFVVGELGHQYFNKKGIPVEQDFRYTVQKPNMSRARIIQEKIVEYFLSGQLDEVYMIYTRMANVMKMEAEVQQLLPIPKKHITRNIPLNVHLEEVTMYPSPQAVIDAIVPNYIAGFIYGGLVESYSSEQNSRMMAMQAATNSAQDMLTELAITYNRVRQAAITQEITEVISGAKAQKKKKKA